MEKIRLHMLAVPHTITNKEFSHCAFTGKVLRFCPMMRSRGFEVYHYGVETSESNATKQIDLFTKEEWEQWRVVSYKFLHKDMDIETVKEKLSNEKNFVGDLGNVSIPLYKEFNLRLSKELPKHYRSMSTDIVCLPFGCAHEEAIKSMSVFAVETGIGYPGSYKPHRIFESHAWKHFNLGKGDINHPSNYWFVVPNYYDISEWPFIKQLKTKRIGYFGRICHIKGLNVFIEIARKFPDIEFIMCGQGDEKEYMGKSPNIRYQKPLHGEERGLFLSSLTAIITASLYIEPFCGTNVEAQICGVPVIAQDFGAFAETIEPFKTGLLCHTLADFCYGVQMALDNKFDREYIRERAIRKYDMHNVAYQYEYVFKSFLDLANHKNGWYSPDSYIHLLDEESRQKIPWYYFYTPDYENWHQHLSGALSEHFDLRPTLTETIPGLHDIHSNHHWMGCDYKVRFFIRCVQENLGKRIVFSDACWGIQAGKTRELEELVRRCKSGMTFTDNDGNGDINIGMVVMDCNEECLAFWKDILTKVQNSNILDQRIINSAIPTPNLLDWKKIVAKCPVSQQKWETEYKNEFLMLKVFTASNQEKKARDEYRLRFMKQYGFNI
jgi:glycosyltransferase involved in cell wall biosynthesis